MRIDGTSLRMVRGDSEELLVACEGPDGAAAPFLEGDRVDLTVKRSAYVRDAAFQKTALVFPEGMARLPILPEDTRELEAGRYRYDVQATFADGTVKTIIPPGDFWIGEDITNG